MITALRQRLPDALFVGVGGPKMAAAGCRLLANPVGRSAMLVGAVFTEARYWMKTLKVIRKELADIQPNVVIPIDSSAINLRIAALAHRQKIPVCYYVAPQVWATRPWRVKKIAANVNTLCCILPFEEPYFRKRRVNAVYVGHPMFDTPADDPAFDPLAVDPPLPGLKPAGESRAATGKSTPRLPFSRMTSSGPEPTYDSPRVALFPGSRRAEIDAHMPAMLEIISEIKGRFPRVNFVAVAPSEERAWQIRHHLRSANTPVDIRVGMADPIIRWADLVLTKSGTATLQVARHAKPMVVMYAVAWWKWHLFAKFVIQTKFISLVNILAGRELVPEYIPFYGSPLPIARECIDMLAKPELRRAMSKELAELVSYLQPHGGLLAADRVAEEVLRLMQPPPAAAQNPSNS